MLRYRRLLLALLSIKLSLTVAQAGPVAADSAAGWRRVALSAGTSVEMPASTKLSPASTSTMRVYVANRQEVLYLLVASRVDSARFAYDDGYLSDWELDRVYEAALKSAVGVNASARVLRRTSFTIAGQRGLDAQLDLPDEDNLKRTKFMRILYANRFVYLLTWRETAAHSADDDATNRQRFFNSLKVKAPPVQRERSIAYRIGAVVGSLLLFQILLVGAFFLIRLVVRAAK